jgi:hypothetical protein
MEDRIAGSSSLGTASWRQISNACVNVCVPILNQHVVQYSYTCSKWCNGKHRSLISSGPKHMCFLWSQELIKRWRSPQHACMMSLVENQSVCCQKLTMIWRVPMAMQFLPKHYVISMEERIAGSSALSTTLSIFIHSFNIMWVLMWLDYQWFDSCDSILSDIQYRFPLYAALKKKTSIFRTTSLLSRPLHFIRYSAYMYYLVRVYYKNLQKIYCL